ncbi:delta-1-pyrroline-5-carboxylate dehydrogenase, mitochondrial-like [Symsagittifera roscoffensis]|uniref:delta-1-pyrroline-5-carboxylate dehydrogenase, mitochondrial-like n=1 Tax=Symsagittifera roscoffensis TaxID=84072 RepID=UPI00307C9BF3
MQRNITKLRLNAQLLTRSLSRTISVQNEPVLSFKKGSSERAELERALESLRKETVTVPVVVGGKEYFCDNFTHQPCPYDHQHKVAKVHLADEVLLKSAIDNALEAREKWDMTPVKERTNIFLKAADLLAGPWRSKILAASMMGQAKTVMQAEIDATCELIDFLRFNSKFAIEMDQIQPTDTDDATNHVIYRGLEGFVAAITPFNFTAISTNLATAPAIMGCVTLWKPTTSATLASWVAYQALLQSGLPDGVIQWVPTESKFMGSVCMQSPHLAALNFTGSTATFKHLWKSIADNVDKYRTFPRIVGETGGKNFHFVHNSAEIESVVGATIRSAFEFQGQKCSACSRMYVPKSKAEEIKRRLVEETNKIEVGAADKFSTFVSAVIDEPAFNRIVRYIDDANRRKNITCLVGGEYSKHTGYFVQPSIYEAHDPRDPMMTEEIFGPVLTIYVYDDSEAEKFLDICNTASVYALTGSIFSQDKAFMELARKKLRHACGNVYLNDKSTGSVVNQQPFGGARLSGTNDKAGSPQYMARWSSPLAVKTAIGDRKTWRYPYMD